MHSRLLAVRLLQLLLGSKLIGVSALLLTAVGSTRRQRSIALTADHLVALVLRGQQTQRGLHNTTSEAEDFEKSGVGAQAREGFDVRTSVDETRSGVEAEASLEAFNAFRSVDLGDTSATVDSLDEDLHADCKREKRD